MTGVTESDHQLISKLQNVLDILDYERRKLYTRRAGCACTEEHLCAFHAAVWDHLNEASRDITRAIKQAESER